MGMAGTKSIVWYTETQKSVVAQSLQCMTIDWMVGVRSWQRQRIFILVSASRPALGPTQPPIQWVTGALFLGVNCGRDVMLTTHPLLVPRLRKCRSYIASLTQSASMACNGTNSFLTCSQTPWTMSFFYSETPHFKPMHYSFILIITFLDNTLKYKGYSAVRKQRLPEFGLLLIL
jgi:hypothetical protein